MCSREIIIRVLRSFFVKHFRVKKKKLADTVRTGAHGTRSTAAGSDPFGKKKLCHSPPRSIM